MTDRQVRNVQFSGAVKVWPTEPGYVVAGWGPGGQLKIDHKTEISNKSVLPSARPKGLAARPWALT
ncbi:hypothetical protein ACH5A3_36785 [Streptomyces echinatus]|uniref:hypothetical protein n=1 Tax=Streptomyces echinatus TaxID=67293 RepID=UPI0037B19DEC